MRNVQIEGVKPRPAGFKDDVLGLVTFRYSFDQIADGTFEVTRWAKETNDRNGKAYTVAKLIPSGAVLVLDAVVREGDHGPWIQTSNFEVPQDVRDEVVKGAVRLLGAKGGGK